MKKQMISGILAIAMAGVLFAGCGRKAEDLPKTQNADAEEDQGEQPESTAKTESESETSAPKENDWFAEQGFVITSQGDFTRNCSLYKENETLERTPDDLYLYTNAWKRETEPEDLLKTADLKGNTEIVDLGAFMGYSSGCVSFAVKFELDKNDLLKEFEDDTRCYIKPVIFCFDRYTGTAMAAVSFSSFDSSDILNENHEKGLDGEAIGFITVTDQDLSEIVFLLDYPKDYDGAVFALQEYREEDKEILREFNEAILNADHTIGNGPEIGPLLHDDCLFFSLTNE